MFRHALIARTAMVDTTPPNTLVAQPGLFRLTGEDMTVVEGYAIQAGMGGFRLIDPGTTQLKPPSDPTSDWVAAVVAAGGSVSTTRQNIVRTFITALNTAGLWNTLDRYWLFAGENTGAANVCLVSGSILTNHGMTFSASGSTTAGYTGDGTSAYIDTGVNLATLGGHFALNNCLAGAQIQNPRTTTINGRVWGAADDAYTTVVAFMPFSTTTVAAVNMNDTTGSGFAAPTTNVRHSFTVTRTAASGAGAVSLYQDGVIHDSENIASSTSLPTSNLYVGALDLTGPYNGTYTTDTLSCFYLGSGWTAAQVTAFEAAQNAMMTSIGINVH